MSTRNEIVNGQMSAVTLMRFDSRWAWNDNECWVWQGHCTAEGYGVMRIGQKRLVAHRVSYEHFVGPIPDGLVLDHLCRNRPCVNPAHLEAVPNAVNVDRGVGITAMQSRQTHCKRGHEFTPENTSVTPKGKRVCRTCHREKVARLKVAKNEKESTVPDLPVEPYTVIRAAVRHDEMPEGFSVPLMLGERYWTGEGWLVAPDELQALITGFEVLAAPLMQDEQTWEETAAQVRRETAKAVLDRVKAHAFTDRSEYRLNAIGNEFGVES